ncbi:MAG: tyrosine-type recombinase/integrase [Xenococcus sp. (in: cyanobacteria)]
MFSIVGDRARSSFSIRLLKSGEQLPIQSYLGHRNIEHTVRYTDLASARFQGFWDG